MVSRESGELGVPEETGERLGLSNMDGVVLILSGYFDQNKRVPADFDRFSWRAIALIGESPAQDFDPFTGLAFHDDATRPDPRIHTLNQFSRALATLTSMKMLDGSPNGAFVYEKGGFWEAADDLRGAVGEDELKVYDAIADELAKEFYEPAE